MKKELNELDRYLKRKAEQQRNDLNNDLKEYVEIYNMLEIDAVNPRLHYEKIEDLEEKIKIFERSFLNIFISSQGYTLQYDEEHQTNIYVKTHKAKRLE